MGLVNGCADVACGGDAYSSESGGENVHTHLDGSSAKKLLYSRKLRHTDATDSFKTMDL